MRGRKKATNTLPTLAELVAKRAADIASAPQEAPTDAVITPGPTLLEVAAPPTPPSVVVAMPKPEPVAPAVLAPARPMAGVERKYIVEVEARIPRGSTYYTLPIGKIISSRGYDIPLLTKLGVRIKELST